MPVRIRLSRVGKKKNAFYRVVAAHREKPRDGRFLEVLGNYDPKNEKKKLSLNKERFEYWMAQGATLSGVIRTTLKKESVEEV